MSSDTGSEWTVKLAKQKATTAKRVRERDKRNSFRQKAKQRLANSPKKLPKQGQNITPLFDSEAEESEVEKEEELDNDTVKERLDNTIDRLEQQEEVYLQEQEETKSEVLNKSNHTTSVTTTVVDLDHAVAST